MRDFQIICLTPPGSADPTIGIAATRAGALGVLDLELTLDLRAAAAALRAMDRFCRAPFGVKLDGRRTDFLDGVTGALPERARTVLLTPGDPDALAGRVRSLRAGGIRVLLEATSIDEAALAARLGADGIIAKGHESAGRVGEETTFILLQRLLARGVLPVWAQGGIGLHTVAAAYAAGAAGVVLDAQLLLTRESPLSAPARDAVGRMDGSETALFARDGESCRLYERSGLSPCDDLRTSTDVLRLAIAGRCGWNEPRRQLLVLGQDAAFAAPLARSFRTVGGVIDGMRRAIETHLTAARSLRPLDENGPLARSHGTRYPIVQGPMTRVSDTAPFAFEVARGGGLPFLALALMRAPEVRALLQETRDALGERPWGVGILGFVPLDLRQEQLEVVREFRPPFALIAGGRPDQAQALERDGITTYLHVPSPGLLKLFLEGGSRRFVFEGRECGGHVGPRSSFVLWNTMVDTILESLPADQVADCHVLFAAGIHDALGASMVAALAAPLAERGARIGVLMGTAYLFTHEAVKTGAIVEGFQRSAVGCERTVLLETGPGHSTRCVDTPFAGAFESERLRLLAEDRPPEEIRGALETLNLGRLRIASKGVDRNPDYGRLPGAPRLRHLTAEEQAVEGMYMIGQVAALRERTCTIVALHRDVSVEGTARLERLDAPRLAGVPSARQEKPSDIAIIGIGCLLPKAPDVATYWENILDKVDAITEVPADRWDWRRYFDADPRARDKVYSKWGGFLDDQPFDPMRYGMPPNSLPSIEPIQLLTLETARAALADAGYLDRPFPRQRTAVILGAGGGISELGNLYAFRSQLPTFIDAPAPELLSRLPEWTEDSFPGILLNVAAGRVANRFDLGGANFTVDAACASSLAALYLAVRELETGSSDMALAGGIDTAQNPFMFLCFSKTRAHAARGRCRTFDEGADGIVISEGLAILVLKRLADAERDGDRVYAVIKAIGSSSDGRDKGLTAPRPEGQALALERAYAKAGFSPATVGLIEAHGTGTVAGDQAEVTTLKRVFEAAGAPPQTCAIGSVKSMIGHTKCTAGVAGMVKVALSLYHKVLPPTLHVEKPNARARLDESPFYVNTELRPWLSPSGGHPRRAGVSAFGFGGTNFHAVLEEYTDEIVAGSPAITARAPAELCLWRGRGRAEIQDQLERLQTALDRGTPAEIADLACTLWRTAAEMPASERALAIIASSTDDLRKKITSALERLRAGAPSIVDPSGIYFTDTPFGKGGRIAFLFPGQGSQYPDMLRDLAVRFPEVRSEFERADRALEGRLAGSLGRRIFPPPPFTPEQERARKDALTETQIAQPALGAAGLAMLRLLRGFGVQADMVAGHSYGEYVALAAASVFDEDTLARLSEARGRCILEAAREDLGTMAAVPEARERVGEILRPIKDVWIANLNAPRQTVISGTRPGVQQAIDRLKKDGIEARLLPVACAFHSPVIAPARDRLGLVLAEIPFGAPQIEVYSNSTAAPYPRDPKAVAAILTEHLVEPVRFADEVEAMHQAGARLFVEVGPRNVLTGLAQQILRERPHLAIASDVPGRPGSIQILHLLGQLAAHAVAVDLDRLFRDRPVRHLGPAWSETTEVTPLSAATWLVNGASARPLGQPARRPAPVTAEPAATAELVAAAKPGAASEPAGAAQAESGPADDATARVVLQFQELMGRFLETQKAVMQAYLQGGGPIPEAWPDQATAAAVPTQDALAIAPAAVASSAVAPTAAAVPPAPSAGADQVSQRDLRERLVAIVGERTGYPAEMLGLDLNIEADLGIDSIKRVEILGAFQRACPAPLQRRLQDSMESLSRIKTLRGILDLAAAAVDAPESARAAAPAASRPVSAAPRPVSAAPPVTVPPRRDVPRFLLRPVGVPLAATTEYTPGDRVVLITDDERGTAAAVAAAIRERGGRAVLLRHGGAATRDEGAIAIDLADPVRVSSVLDQIRRAHGPIGGLLHLLPLGTDPDPGAIDAAAWNDRLTLEVRSLFLLGRALRPDFREAGPTGRLVAATAMGGAYGLDLQDGQGFFPGQAALTGLVKTLAREWPGTGCTSIDFEAGATPERRAALVLQELGAGDDEVEVGYRGARRFAVRPLPAEIEAETPARLAPDASWVVLVTGGARGITAEIAQEIAERYRPTLILAGRSPLPDAVESPVTAGLVTPQEIKAALINELRGAASPATPAAVETACRRLLQDRDIRRHLEAMRRAGATVRYVQVDVRDSGAVERLIDGLYREHGRIDAVIHGAGVIEDRLIEDKTPESFDRVFGTKVDGALALAGCLRSEDLKLFVLFASVAGRFGNPGQCDYAAANETLNALALQLDRVWPGRVVAINWGPWNAGMASAEVQGRFAARGVQLVAPEGGRPAFIHEIERGAKGEASLVLGDGPWRRPAAAPAPPAERTKTREDLPLLNGLALRAVEQGTVEVTRMLDTATDLFLLDHQMDGRPILPAAVAMELFAEVVRRGWPEWEIQALQEFRVLNGVVLKDGPRPIRIRARAATSPDPERHDLQVDVAIVDPESGRTSYQASVLLGGRLPSPPPGGPTPLRDARPYPLSVEGAYERFLFHGPLFQGIRTIESLSEEGIIGTVHPSTPSRCVRGANGGDWLIDPVVVDGALQLGILYARSHFDMTPLPARFRSFRRFAPFNGSPIRCEFRSQARAGGHVLDIQIAFLDGQGRLLGMMEDLELSCSRELNRLAGPRGRT